MVVNDKEVTKSLKVLFGQSNIKIERVVPLSKDVITSGFSAGFKHVYLESHHNHKRSLLFYNHNCNSNQ